MSSKSDRQNQERDPTETERHWSATCLGIVTVATAATGATLFGSDLTAIAVPGASPTIWALSIIKWTSALTSILLYVWMVYEAGKIIIPIPDGHRRIDFSPSRQTGFVYTLFFGEVVVLVSMLISNLLINALTPTPVAPLPYWV